LIEPTGRIVVRYSKHEGVLTDRVVALTNNLFVNLADMD
jgi:catalase (peroxidase I)